MAVDPWEGWRIGQRDSYVHELCINLHLELCDLLLVRVRWLLCQGGGRGEWGNSCLQLMASTQYLTWVPGLDHVLVSLSHDEGAEGEG